MSLYFQHPLLAVMVYLAGMLLLNLCVPAKAVEYHRISTLTVSIFALLFGLLSCLSFDKGVTGFQFPGTLSMI
jgi:hypothetical protein